MRTNRFRILVTCGAVAAVGVGIGAWQLVPSGDGGGKPITVGSTDIVSSLDPAAAYDAGSWAMINNIYQSLLTFRPSSTVPTGDAAKSCAFAPGDPLTYTCTLRDGVMFSNGDRMTGADVAFSIKRVIGIKDPQGPSSLFANIRSVDSHGQQVTFRLKAADATFPSKLATGAGAIVDRKEYPADRLRADSTVVGSGPYTLKAYKAGTSATLEPNPTYVGADKTGSPVEVDYFSSPDALGAAWRDGRVDVANRQLPPSLTASVDASSTSMHVTEAASAEIRSLIFNTRKDSSMGDKAIRRAIAAVVDRDRITTDVYDSTVEPLYSLVPQGITSHTTPFFDMNPKPDVDKAADILKEAGVKTPVSFTLAYSPGGAAGPEASELRRQLEATGLFEVKVLSKEWTMFKKGFAAGDYDAYTIGWAPDFPDPQDFVAPLVGTDNTFHNGFSNQQVDRMISATQQYSRRGEASKDFQQVQRIVADDVPLLPLWQRKEYVLAQEDITGSQYLTDGTGLFRLWELDRT